LRIVTRRRAQSETDPPEKLPFDCQKNAKNLTFKKKNCPKFSFFSKKLTLATFWQFFDSPMAILRRVRCEGEQSGSSQQ